MSKFRITVLHWDKFNQRSRDYKKPWWFSFSNQMVEDPEFFDFNGNEFKAWIYLLSQASKKGGGQFFVNIDHAKVVSNIPTKDFLSAIDKLTGLGHILAESGQMLARSDHYRTEQNNTEQNNTPQSGLRESDFDEAYKIYPRKLGKAEGIRKLKASIKNAEELLNFRHAVERYAAHCKEKQTDEKFIKHFSSFVSTWRDWLDPETGSSTAKASGDIDWSFLEKGAE